MYMLGFTLALNDIPEMYPAFGCLPLLLFRSRPPFTWHVLSAEFHDHQMQFRVAEQRSPHDFGVCVFVGVGVNL